LLPAMSKIVDHQGTKDTKIAPIDSLPYLVS
jgi:hypothetical protein